MKLLTLGLCLFSHSLFALELSNGIKVYIEEHTSPELWGSFKVVFKQPSLNHTYFSYDPQVQEWDTLNDFFHSCVKKAATPTDAAVIAVGDFPSSQMQKLIEEHFNSLQLTPSDESHFIEYNDNLPNSQVAITVNLPNSPSWQSIFLQELLQQRFEECIRTLGEIWLHPYPQLLYPVPGIAIVSEDNAENTLSFLLHNIQLLKEDGFYPEAFATKKKQLLHKLHYLNASSPDLTLLSTYYKDQFLLGQNSPPEEFLPASLAAVEEIQPEDLIPLLTPFLEQEPKIRITHSSTPQFILVSNDAKNNSFYQLPLSSREMDIIDTIITTMAKDNLIQLAFNRRSIEKKGKKIEHVHPLRFMGHIMSTKSLREHARVIKKSSFKWDAFVDGFGKRMKEELGHNNVYQHVPGFAQLVAAKPDHINHYIHKRDWDGLVKSLL
jgi:hypothetical protein